MMQLKQFKMNPTTHIWEDISTGQTFPTHVVTDEFLKEIDQLRKEAAESEFECEVSFFDDANEALIQFFFEGKKREMYKLRMAMA
jgi:poly(A) polymerase Pap1